MRPACLRGVALAVVLTVGGAVYGAPAAAPSEGGLYPQLMTALHDTVDLIGMSVADQLPRRDVNHLNQALHQFLMVLEGGRQGGRHGHDMHHFWHGFDRLWHAGHGHDWQHGWDGHFNKGLMNRDGNGEAWRGNAWNGPVGQGINAGAMTYAPAPPVAPATNAGNSKGAGKSHSPIHHGSVKDAGHAKTAGSFMHGVHEAPAKKVVASPGKTARPANEVKSPAVPEEMPNPTDDFSEGAGNGRVAPKALVAAPGADGVNPNNNASAGNNNVNPQGPQAQGVTKNAGSTPMSSNPGQSKNSGNFAGGAHHGAHAKNAGNSSKVSFDHIIDRRPKDANHDRGPGAQLGNHAKSRRDDDGKKHEAAEGAAGRHGVTKAGKSKAGQQNAGTVRNAGNASNTPAVQPCMTKNAGATNSKQGASAKSGTTQSTAAAKNTNPQSGRTTANSPGSQLGNNKHGWNGNRKGGTQFVSTANSNNQQRNGSDFHRDHDDHRNKGRHDGNQHGNQSAFQRGMNNGNSNRQGWQNNNANHQRGNSAFQRGMNNNGGNRQGGSQNNGTGNRQGHAQNGSTVNSGGPRSNSGSTAQQGSSNNNGKAQNSQCAKNNSGGPGTQLGKKGKGSSTASGTAQNNGQGKNTNNAKGGNSGKTCAGGKGPGTQMGSKRPSTNRTPGTNGSFATANNGNTPSTSGNSKTGTGTASIAKGSGNTKGGSQLTGTAKSAGGMKSSSQHTGTGKNAGSSMNVGRANTHAHVFANAGGIARSANVHSAATQTAHRSQPAANNRTASFAHGVSTAHNKGGRK